MKNWVVLFSRSGSEDKTINELKGVLNNYGFLPFAPLKEKAQRNKGIITKKCERMFPGYILLQTEIEPKQITENLRLALRENNLMEKRNIYSILHYGDDKQDIVMHETERLQLERLLDDSFCVAGSVGFIEGDKIWITSGPLKGMESHIIKINRHKREATIEMEMMGAVRQVQVMLEVVSKI